MKVLVRSVLLALMVLLAPSVEAKKPKTLQYDNPLALQRADPFIARADGMYYFIATVPEYDRIEIRKSKTINGIKTAEPVVVWRKKSQGPMGNHIWAPELHRIGGKWYI
ncbi:MAG: family 43 glycosylhydrolase, partial [Bacteroidales bacterium]|nr:family 43 glycosylhydrolase [Bacteroidales bacterium]